jgi:predicted Zn-dependent protease
MSAQLEALAARERGDRGAAVDQLTRLLASPRAAGVARVGPPAAIPLPETLGATLLAAKRPQEAAAAYERALAERPNRSAAWLGLARAKTAGDDAAPPLHTRSC